MCHIVLLCVESGNVGVKLIDLGNCFSPTGTDTSRISFEMQTLPFRAPEVQSTVFLTMAMSLLHNSIQCHAVQCSTQSLLHEPNGSTPPTVGIGALRIMQAWNTALCSRPCSTWYIHITAGQHLTDSMSQHQHQHQQARDCLLA